MIVLSSETERPLHDGFLSTKPGPTFSTEHELCMEVAQPPQSTLRAQSSKQVTLVSLRAFKLPGIDHSSQRLYKPCSASGAMASCLDGKLAQHLLGVKPQRLKATGLIEHSCTRSHRLARLSPAGNWSQECSIELLSYSLVFGFTTLRLRRGIATVVACKRLNELLNECALACTHSTSPFVCPIV